MGIAALSEAEVANAIPLSKDQQDKFASLKGKEFDLSQLIGFGIGGRGGRPNQLLPKSD